MASTISGVFFHRLAPAASSAHAVHFHVLSQQLLSSPGHGVRIEIEEVGQLAIATTAQLQRLQSDIQTALLLIQQAVEQEDGGFQFLLRNLKNRRICHGGNGLDGAARQ